MKIKPGTQLEKIVQYVTEHGNINAVAAFKHLGVTRLAARVLELKGTEYALKPVKSELGGSFVNYIPDSETRTHAITLRVAKEFLANYPTVATNELGESIASEPNVWLACNKFVQDNANGRAA